jgi:outer membrane protein insertion porin family
VETPVLTNNPGGTQLTNANGQPLFTTTVGPNGEALTVPVETTAPTAVDGTPNRPQIIPGTNISEVFVGDSPSPRITAGIGVNWNSPFGPFRIDFSQTIRKIEGDDERTFTFNVGTQF